LTIQRIRCRPAVGDVLRCDVRTPGARYVLVDRIQPPASVNRAKLVAALANPQLSRADRRRIAADLASVPDSFLARLTTLLGFGTYGSDGMIPPRGIPMWLACGIVGGSIACRDLNGDEHTPVGSSIYKAVEGPGWRRAPATAQPDATNARLFRSILGAQLTPAESRLLRDILGAASASGSDQGGPTRAPTPSKGG
jgi:hypothetical protein